MTERRETSCFLKARKAVPNEVSVDAATASDTSELEYISSLKEEQGTVLKAFIDGKDVFTLHLTGKSTTIYILLHTPYGSLT